jgi:oligopeptide/dipeptide ABC transporter ATP-binding protein
MYLGRIVEIASTDSLFARPLHPYTRSLMAAIPRPDPHRRGGRVLAGGDVPSPMDPPPGCHFHTRCAFADDRCRREDPVLREVAAGHSSACHYAEALPPMAEVVDAHVMPPAAARRMAMYAERRANITATAG